LYDTTIDKRTFNGDDKDHIMENVRLFKLWRNFDALSTLFSMAGLVSSIIFYELYVYPCISKNEWKHLSCDDGDDACG
jgi:hypothetical protein